MTTPLETSPKMEYMMVKGVFCGINMLPDMSSNHFQLELEHSNCMGSCNYILKFYYYILGRSPVYLVDKNFGSAQIF